MAEVQQNAAHAGVDPAYLSAMRWRLIGPFRGGRVVAVAADPNRSNVYYFGSTGGGVWKTDDSGTTWRNISDGYFKRASVGALAVAPSDPNVIYVGMGEATIRGNVSHGDGVYRSTDGGAAWTHLGLEQTRNIGKVRVDPRDPDVAYVAALGHAHGPNPERGVYRTRDGGKTWQHVLFRSEKAGAIDLSIDPNNPRIIFASFWEASRGPYSLNSGGEGSGLFRSMDGGDTWTEVSRNPGLPKGVLGKIGVAVSPARPGRVYANVEAEDGAFFRSDDNGETWQRLAEDRPLRERAWYYLHVVADPQDADTVWALSTRAWKSIDGGKTFSEVKLPHGDNHDLWIDPRNPQRMIEGNDGGATISVNGGETWTSLYNQPTAEFYHVTTDTQTPYRVYGAQQDNTTITVPSRSALSGITTDDAFEIGGGESGYIAVRPDKPNIVFAGSYGGLITRFDARTHQIRDITVWPETGLGSGAKDVKYRFQWTAPLVLSPHDPNVLFATGNHVFRSTDEGSSWEMISPDLTRHEPHTLEPSGGPITKDNTGAEYYATIFAFAESPVQQGVFWAGSDDGLIHVSRNGGDNWENVTPSDLPEWALISILEPSPHDPAVAYLAATRYKTDDFRPYLYKTSDYGKTWTKIVEGIGESDFTRVIREDPQRRGLLFAGTETGIYVSFDDGAHWQPIRLNLPVVPIHDLVVKDNDLVVATHGRSFWILDDIAPLRQMTDEVRQAAAHVFAPVTTIRFKTNFGFSQPGSPGVNYRMSGAKMVGYRTIAKPDGTTEDVNLDAGQNPPDAVRVYYTLREAPKDKVTLTFLDAQGNEIKSFSSKEEEPEGEQHDEAANGAKAKKNGKNGKNEPTVSKDAGLNVFLWDMRYPGADRIEGYVASEGALAGPVAAPGTYTVRLTAGGETSEQRFQIVKDPRVEATDADLDAQFALLMRVRDKVTETHRGLNALRSVKRQVADWEKRVKGQPGAEAVTEAGKALTEKLTAIEEVLVQTKAQSRQDTLDFPVKLNGKLANLSGVVSSADAAPTRQAYAVFEDLSKRIDEQLRQLHTVLETDLSAFNAAVASSGVPFIVPSETLDE